MKHLTDAELLQSLGPMLLNHPHLAHCAACRQRQDLLSAAIQVLGMPPAITPTTTAADILQRDSRVKTSKRTPFLGGALAIMAALIGFLASVPAAPGPIAMPSLALRAEDVSFAQSRVAVQWKPGSPVGLMTVSHMPPMAHRVLEVWMIHGRHHVPVAIIPSVSGITQVAFAVPNPDIGYQAIGITLEPSPDMPAPTGPKVFFVSLLPPSSKL